MASNIVYVAREIERAMGIPPIDNYFIITNESPYALEIKEKYTDNVFLIKSEKILDTYELLNLIEVQEIINKLNGEIIVFKNTIHIESLCKEKNFKLLNPSSELSERIENKITQISWLEDLASLLPKYSITNIKDIKWEKNPFIIQWSHGHTGDGTLLIPNENELNKLIEKFPHREAKITEYIKGPAFTVNIVVTNTDILLGNISYQITGMLPFTKNPFSTIGNDWSLTHTILNESHINTIHDIAEKIGRKMQKENWKGLFGIDIIYNEEKDEINLIEINARQPASTTYESELQSYINMHGVEGINTFQAHILALKNENIINSLIPINDGAQILQRVTKNAVNMNPINLIKAGYKVIIYKNTKENEDLLRIQSIQGIMETHNKFNKRGKEILDLLV